MARARRDDYRECSYLYVVFRVEILIKKDLNQSSRQCRPLLARIRPVADNWMRILEWSTEISAVLRIESVEPSQFESHRSPVANKCDLYVTTVRAVRLACT